MIAPELERIRTGLAEDWYLPACCAGGGYTYVIAAGGMIKIGQTGHVRSRIEQIQAMCPNSISMLGLARGARLETTLHKICKAHRAHHEWFRPEAWPLIAHRFANMLKCAGCQVGL